MANSKAGERIGVAGRQKDKWEEKSGMKMEEQKKEEEDSRVQPPSYTASHRVRRKVYRNRERLKSSEAKGKWDNLRKAG